jgi:hypothetical protein
MLFIFEIASYIRGFGVLGYSMKELAIVRFSEVNFSLASFNVLKPNFVLQINAPDG